MKTNIQSYLNKQVLNQCDNYGSTIQYVVENKNKCKNENIILQWHNIDHRNTYNLICTCDGKLRIDTINFKSFLSLFTQKKVEVSNSFGDKYYKISDKKLDLNLDLAESDWIDYFNLVDGSEV